MFRKVSTFLFDDAVRDLFRAMKRKLAAMITWQMN